MNTVTVRAYKPEDLPAMIEIWNEVVREGNAFPQEDTLNAASGKSFFASQTHCGVACDQTNAVLGLYILHPNNVGRCGHLCNASYAVASAHRGKAIGEALVRDCLHVAKETGFRILQFNAVVATNTRARRLYEKLGFTRLGVIPGGFRMPDGTYTDICPYYIKL